MFINDCFYTTLNLISLISFIQLFNSFFLHLLISSVWICITTFFKYMLIKEYRLWLIYYLFNHRKYLQPIRNTLLSFYSMVCPYSMLCLYTLSIFYQEPIWVLNNCILPYLFQGFLVYHSFCRGFLHHLGSLVKELYKSQIFHQTLLWFMGNNVYF